MTELLKNASVALIANDAETLEGLAREVSVHAGSLRMMGRWELGNGIAPAAEVLRRQVLAASVQLATRRRLSATSSMQAHPWDH